jgi:CrcB protein
VAAGGALGAPARYGMAHLVHVDPGTFPWATFAINLSGSLVLGVIVVVVARRFPSDRFLRPFVATGFLGAYTTYSTFAVETVVLAKDGRPGVAAVYAVASLVAGFAAAAAGIAAGGRFVPRDHEHDDHGGASDPDVGPG